MSSRRSSPSTPFVSWVQIGLVGGIGGLIALLFVVSGVGAHAAHATDDAPLEVDFAEFVRERPDATWLRLRDCQLHLPSALGFEGVGEPREVFVPVHAPRSDSGRVHVVLRTRDPAYLSFLDELGEFDGDEQEYEFWLSERAEAAFPLVTLEGLLDRRAPERAELREHIADPAPDLAVLNDGARPFPPRAFTGIVLVGLGLVIAGITAYACVLVHRRRRRPHGSRADAIAQVFAADDDTEPVALDPDDVQRLAPRPPIDDDVSRLPGIYRVEQVMIVERGAETWLPARCVQCDAPTEGPPPRRSFAWHHPAIYLLLLLSPLLYILVALLVRKTSVIDVPTCDAHRSQRTRAIVIGWTGFGLSFLTLPTAATHDLHWLFVFSLIGVFAFPLWGIVRARSVRAAFIDGDETHLVGACEPFLAELPPAPGT